MVAGPRRVRGDRRADPHRHAGDRPERAAPYRDRQELRLPPSPQPYRPADVAASTDGAPVTGLAASGGVALRRAPVVHDPATAEIEDGDILVCEATDPGWISLFLVAGAVVTDHGGMLSHGPVVARELGLPGVCGTTDGSRRIRDGQQARVDGDRGVVERLG